MGTVNVTLGEDTRLNLILGQQDENEVREVVFDFSGWYATYGSGTISLSVQRSKDQWPYEVELTVDNTNHTATWTITDTDTGYAGVGMVQITYTVGTAKKKSVVYRFTVYKSLGATGNVITPVQLQTWMDEVDQEITDIKQDLAGLSGVPNTVRQAIYTLLNNGGFADIGLTDEIAIVEEWASVSARAIALSQNSITFTSAGTQQLTAILTPPDTTDVVYWTSSDETVAVVSSSGLVTAVGNGSCNITAQVGSCIAICSVTVSGMVRIFNISNTLTKAENSNSAVSVIEGDTYSATITGVTGYSVADSDIVVTMGGNTLSGVVSSGVISIASVTGDITVTATGTLKGTNYMTDVNTTNWNRQTHLLWVDTDGHNFTGKNDADGASWGNNMIQKNLSVTTDTLQGKTVFLEFDVTAMSGATRETDECRAIVCAFDRSSPTGGGQRKGVAVQISAFDTGHYSLEMPVDETEMQLSSSYYLGLMFYFTGPAGFQVTVENLAYTYY